VAQKLTYIKKFKRTTIHLTETFTYTETKDIHLIPAFRTHVGTQP